MKRIVAALIFLLMILTAPVSLFAQQTSESFTGPKITKFVKGPAELPKESGQFWSVYDLSPYLTANAAVKNPEKTILNWILQDTGNDFWHGDPMGVLSFSGGKLYVYHNAKVQQYVSNVLDRFLDEKHKTEVFTIRLILLESPDWRTKAAEWIRPYPVKSTDTQGWILSPENRAKLLEDLSRRIDYIDLNRGQNRIPNGETFGWLYAAPPRNFTADIQIANNSAGYITNAQKIDEGYRIEVTPLLSTDGTQIEFAFRCQTTVVERMLSFNLKIPTIAAPRQQLPAELPQILHAERKEKVSFPKNSVFLLDLGMMPLSLGNTQQQNNGPLIGLARMVSSRSPVYYQLLMIIESVGEQTVEPATENKINTLPSGN